MATQNIEIRVLDKTAGALRGISGRLTALNTGLLGVNRVAGLAATAVAAIGGTNIIKNIVTTTARFQDLRTALSSVTGGARQGADAFNFIAEFSTKTQFGVEELTQAYIKLQAAGITPTEELLTTFTDTAAVTTDQIGSLQAITDLFSRTTSGGLGLEELNRLADRGVPVFRLLEEQLGLTRLQVSEFGKTTEGAEKIRNALVTGLNQSFGGATAARVNNLSTQMSNLSIAFDNALDKIGQQGMATALGDLVVEITDTITSNEELVKSIGLNLTKAFLAVVATGKFVIANIDLIGKAFIAFFALKVALAVGSIAFAFGSVLVKGLVLATRAVKALTLAAAANPFIAAGLVIAAGVEYLTGAFSKLAEKMNIGGVADTALDALESGFGNVQELIVGPDGIVQGIDEFSNSMSNLTADAQTLQDRANSIEESTGETATNTENTVRENVNNTQELEKQQKKYDEILNALQFEVDLIGESVQEREILKEIKAAELAIGRELTETEAQSLRNLRERLQLEQKIADAEKALPGIVSETGGAFGAGSSEEEALAEKIKNLDILRNNDKISEERYQKLKTSLQKQYSQARLKNLQEETNAQFELIKAGRASEVDLTKLSREQINDLTIKTGRELLGELAKNNKAAFVAQKALAIADAVMNTARGITAALALGPVGIPLAIAIGALGAVQIGTIASQRYQGRARGGNVDDGTPYMVGERGPEMFVPRERGTIISNENLRQMGSGRGNQPVNVSFNIQANDTAGFDQLITQRRGLIVNLINTALNERGKEGIV